MVSTEKQLKGPREKTPQELLDPDNLFRAKYDAHGKSTRGLERFVYEYMPMNLIRSFAIAIDPFHKFKVSPVKITPVNRLRYRKLVSVLDQRSMVITRTTLARSKLSSWYGPDIGCATSEGGGTTNSVTTFPLDSQPGDAVRTYDTTVKTRPISSHMGEFETFKYTLISPEHRVSSFYETTVRAHAACGDQYNQNYAIDRDIMAVGPHGGVLSSASLDSLRTTETESLSLLMQNKALSMLPKTVPASRRYSLFRNVVELRDLPSAISSLRKSIEDVRSAVSLLSSKEKRKFFDPSALAKDIPNEYVSYWFAWRQILRDAIDLLNFPARAAKEVNFLIERSGKPTTFRTQEKFLGETTDSPSFQYDSVYWEFDKNESTSHSREHSFRCAINATFDFPHVDVPHLRRELYLRKLGVRPTVTDIYNLIPWSWLVDWATGLGNYVQAIDVINTDKSLFNYGFLTGTTIGKIQTLHTGKTRSASWTLFYGYGGWSGGETLQTYRHTSICEYKVQIRKNISSAFHVPTIAEKASLSPYQLSILGAILLARGKDVRHITRRG